MTPTFFVATVRLEKNFLKSGTLLTHFIRFLVSSFEYVFLSEILRHRKSTLALQKFGIKLNLNYVPLPKSVEQISLKVQAKQPCMVQSWTLWVATPLAVN